MVRSYCFWDGFKSVGVIFGSGPTTWKTTWSHSLRQRGLSSVCGRKLGRSEKRSLSGGLGFTRKCVTHRTWIRLAELETKIGMARGFRNDKVLWQTGTMTDEIYRIEAMLPPPSEPAPTISEVARLLFPVWRLVGLLPDDLEESLFSNSFGCNEACHRIPNCTVSLSPRDQSLRMKLCWSLCERVPSLHTSQIKWLFFIWECRWLTCTGLGCFLWDFASRKA